MGRHSASTTNHRIHHFEYADEAARTGAVGLTADDVGRVARQLDTKTFWILQNHSPLKWAPIDSEASDVLFTRTISPDSMGVAHADFPSLNIVPTDLDNTNPRFPVAVMDDTVFGIRWWETEVPGSALYGVNATRLYLIPRVKAASAPPSTKGVGFRLYYANMPIGSAPPAWRNIYIGDVHIGPNLFWHDGIFPIDIGVEGHELNVVPGQALLLGIEREFPTTADPLSGNAHLGVVTEGWGFA
jgi:hypothetical protein